MGYSFSAIAVFVYLPFIKPGLDLACNLFFLKKITNLENLLSLSYSRSLIKVTLMYFSFELMGNNVRRSGIAREMYVSN
jgi:hypothetical protein